MNLSSYLSFFFVGLACIVYALPIAPTNATSAQQCNSAKEIPITISFSSSNDNDAVSTSLSSAAPNTLDLKNGSVVLDKIEIIKDSQQADKTKSATDMAVLSEEIQKIIKLLANRKVTKQYKSADCSKPLKDAAKLNISPFQPTSPGDDNPINHNELQQDLTPNSVQSADNFPPIPSMVTNCTVTKTATKSVVQIATLIPSAKTIRVVEYSMTTQTISQNVTITPAAQLYSSTIYYSSHPTTNGTGVAPAWPREEQSSLTFDTSNTVNKDSSKPNLLYSSTLESPNDQKWDLIQRASPSETSVTVERFRTFPIQNEHASQFVLRSQPFSQTEPSEIDPFAILARMFKEPTSQSPFKGNNTTTSIPVSVSTSASVPVPVPVLALAPSTPVPVSPLPPPTPRLIDPTSNLSAEASKQPTAALPSSSCFASPIVSPTPTDETNINPSLSSYQSPPFTPSSSESTHEQDFKSKSNDNNRHATSSSSKSNGECKCEHCISNRHKKKLQKYRAKIAVMKARVDTLKEKIEQCDSATTNAAEENDGDNLADLEKEVMNLMTKVRKQRSCTSSSAAA